MQEIIEKIKLQIQIIQIQLQILLLQKKMTVPNLPNPCYLIIHHSAGDWNFQQVNEYHKQIWSFSSSLGFYAGYAYFIEKSGKVYQARRDNEEQAHVIGYNKNSIGICLQGNFEFNQPTEEQLKSLRELIEKKKAEYKIPNERVLSHSEVANTLCCGKNLFKWLVQNYPS